MNKKVWLLSTALVATVITPASITVIAKSIQPKPSGYLNESKNWTINPLVSKRFDLEESQQYFFNYINWINQQKEPIAIFNVSASLPYQEALFVAMVHHFNNASNQLTMIQEEKSRTGPRYNVDKLMKLNDSPLNILNPDSQQPNNITTTIQPGKINVLYDQREPNAFIPPNKSRVAEDHIQPILEFLTQTKANNKVNIILPDVFFIQLFDAWSPTVNDPLIQLIARAKSILLTTDGAAHIVTVVENGLLKFLLSDQFAKQPENVVLRNLKAIQELDANVITNLTKNDIYNILLLKKTVDNQFDFIHFVHYDSSYANNLFTNKTDDHGNHTELINDTNKWNVSSVSLNVLDYAKLLIDQTQVAKFVNYFDTAFFVDQPNDIFVSFDANNFDPNKKTAIFVGSSLFSPQNKNHEVTSLEEFVNLRSYIQESFRDFLNKYPPDEFNIVFKHHPIYSAQDAIKLTQIYTDNQIEVPNIINSRIPFEYLLTSEYAKAQRNESSLLFFKNQNKIEPKFKLFGFQATTSLIHTTRLFLETSLNLTQAEIDQVVSFDDFPVPTLFDVIVKPAFDPKKYNKFASNKIKIENTYRFFNPSQWNSELDKQNDRFLFDEIKPLGNDHNLINDLMINVLFALLVVLVVSNLAVIPTSVYLIKKKNKQRRQTLFFR